MNLHFRNSTSTRICQECTLTLIMILSTKWFSADMVDVAAVDDLFNVVVLNADRLIYEYSVGCTYVSRNQLLEWEAPHDCMSYIPHEACGQ